MLHESDLRKFQRCDKYYWYSKQKSIPFFPFATCNYNLVELTKAYFHFENVFIGERGDDVSKAIEAYHQKKVLMDARIGYRDLRMKIPCLVQKDGKNILYLLYAQCYPKVFEAQKAADLLWVLEKNQITVDDIYLVHINADYVFEDELDIHKCLLVSDEFYNERNRKCGKVKDIVKEYQRDLDELLDQIKACEDMSQVKKKRTPVCTTHYKCEFFQDCFPEQYADTSILNLVQSSKKYECEEMGITDMAMVCGDEIEGSRIQYAQVMAAKKQGLFIDYMALTAWMDKIVYPLIYLDFEWQTFVYPPYKGMKPYDVLVFQYSMHIEEEGKELVHEQFIGSADCRIAFIEDLIEKIPSTGTIFVFNAQGAEALRLQQLAKQFPKYENKLRSIWERMVDLAIPFSNGLVYDCRMAGEYNLKKLLSLFSPYSYQDLAIHQGLLAVKKYQEYEETHSETIRQELFDYCGMDTYAEYILFHYLKKQVEDNRK